MLALYNALLAPVRLATALLAAWRARTPEARVEWDERRARRLPDPIVVGAWIHGASLGEARLVRGVAEGLRARRPRLGIAVSATTRTGREALPQPPLADRAFFLPLDFPGLPGRVLDRLSPSLLVLVETELWPNLIHEAAARGVAVLVANGRLSPERMHRYRRLRALYRPILARLARVGAQSEDDAERFAELGIPRDRVVVTGNLKYDLAPPAVDREALRTRFGVAHSRPTMVAGSTAEGEDGPVLDAFLRVRTGHPRGWLVLAPRHPERAADVRREAERRGLAVRALSEGRHAEAGSCDVLLVDRVGELSRLYALADVAFVGGSLAPVGGHNVLEPAALGVPVALGPHTHHVAEPAAALVAAGGAFRVADGVELAAVWSRMLGDAAARERAGAAGRDLVERNRGALARTLDLVTALLSPGAPP